jgi:hypothetical protein
MPVRYRYSSAELDWIAFTATRSKWMSSLTTAVIFINVS